MRFEFHVSRDARQRYQFDEALFGLSGNVVFADYAAARRFAHAMNAQRDLGADAARTVRAGDINAMGLVDEILHHVIDLYRRQRNPAAMAGALAALDQSLGAETLEAALVVFADRFPTVAAYRGEQSAADYLAGRTDGIPNREIALEELLMVWLANGNPAFGKYEELFEDTALADGSAYDQLIEGLRAYFRTQPGFGPDGDDLISLLQRPAREAAGSLSEQLRWISGSWGFAAERFSDYLTIGLDVIREDEQAEWKRFNPSDGGPVNVFGGGAEGESGALHGFGDAGETGVGRFSQDLDWMPRVTLLAKSTYVWLDQLSRSYGRPILRLDQIPDEELDAVAEHGFTGLWLIGLWERSRASQQIKQLRGNPEAVASAYSLMDYRIADDLGGDAAYANLRDRAWARGIRLASDMVPNHMGIDSRWVIEHPDWFIQRAEPPYPVYSYNGPNLSSDERVGIHIEDHYYDNSDAAVTFRRVDRYSGQERFIYHGNDGTSMPWNDTAQLDYLRADVREAVIQTILHVARQFPIIRFDAAMTLAKKHIQRLWYPEPGEGGAIPSRAENAMRKADFDAAMPVEFWREVVDRVAAEAPDTLLLAEAFWLMEGYFVRTLGMHRVYNSAFMNMLRDEQNAEYRTVIKNTLEFDPQILKRYVNFMNNPDERTAVDQFGKGDKYFGVATLMATMPGLPMFGHGQVEGFAERYGMEYRRAYIDETPDLDLVARHEREIFPLLHRRWLFAEVADFALYDFVDIDGNVNEDVFAFSNMRGGERSLIVFHNKSAATRGWIKTATVTGKSLRESLALPAGETEFVLLHDGRSGLEYLRSARELADKGLYVELHAYETQAFLEMRELSDTDGRWGRLAAELNGRGVASLGDALRDLEMAPLHIALRTDDATAAVRHAAALVGREPPAGVSADGAARVVDEFLAKARPDLARGKWIYEWQLEKVVPDADLTALRLDLAARQAPDGAAAPDGLAPRELLADDRFRRLIGVNEADGVTWFNKEDFARVVTALALPRVEDLIAAAEKSGYKLDELVRLAAEPPSWVSTRPPRPTPRGGRSSNKRDQSMPPRPQPKNVAAKVRASRVARTKEK
ncbi:MAG TPA: alpha-amylase family glycosyl hydrolase [Candidatus Limnocylindria bacterium]|nr:alpha-amylase family glycosyl hydrolase [Candidatus Limnocylindria bacterium]